MLIGSKVLLRFRFSVAADHYKAMGLLRTASSSQIKSKYYQLAKLHHPDMDKFKDDTDFIKIKQAYEVLGNLDKKSLYDQELSGENVTRANRKEGQFYNKYEGGPTNTGDPTKSQHLLVWFGIGSVVCIVLSMIVNRKSKRMTDFDVRRNNLLLRNQNVSSSTGVQQRRRKMLEEQRKQKKFSIVPITFYFDENGVAHTNENNIKPRKKKSGKAGRDNRQLADMAGVRKRLPKRQPVQNLNSEKYM